MSEKEPSTSEPGEGQSSRPRNPDGTFMSKTQVEKLQKKVTDATSYLSENNQALMAGTPFSNDYFKGMNDLQVNKFLLNYHKQKKEDKPAEEVEPNTPILGTPVGSGRNRYYIDQFLTMDPKERTIDFTAPASVVLAKHKNKEEARNKWLDQR